MKKLRIRAIKFIIDINEKLFFERRLGKFYKSHLPLDTVIDVGANKGQSIAFFLSINPACRIYAIEANPGLFARLQRRYGHYPNIRLFHMGISDTEGTKLFYENVFDYTSSFQELNPDSAYLKKKARVLGVEKEKIVAKQYMVTTQTLSAFIRNEVKEERIDVIKIDTEGHEFYCLQGLFTPGSRAGIGYIQLENHNDDMYISKVPFAAIDSLLQQNGFIAAQKIKHGFGDFDEIIYGQRKQ